MGDAQQAREAREGLAGAERAIRYYVPDDRRRESALECLASAASRLVSLETERETLRAERRTIHEWLNGFDVERECLLGRVRRALEELRHLRSENERLHDERQAADHECAELRRKCDYRERLLIAHTAEKEAAVLSSPASEEGDRG